MKKLTIIIAIISLAMSACTTQKQATSYVNDDVYSSSSTLAQSTPAPQQAASGAQVITSPDKTAGQKPSSSTLESDYNDYSYSSRINRFNSKDTTKGYFDESYSGSSSNDVSANNDPNVNLYLGVGGGYGGFYGSSMGFGMGWGYPYSNWGWDYGWGYPYYGFGYPYYGYGWGYPYYGYNPWYYPCCYCYGYNDWYYGGYPPYYTTSTYYGSRKSLYRSDGGDNALNGRSSANLSGATTNPNSRNSVTPAYSRDNVSASQRTVQPTTRTVSASQEQYRYTRSSNTKQASYQRSTKPVQGQTRGQQPTPRYVRPENATAAQRSGSAQSYSSPAYRQPKSSQEYLTPRSQNPAASRATNQNQGTRNNTGSYGTGSRQASSPSNENRTYTSPSRSGSYGTSSGRTAPSYTTPARSGSSGSYTAPVRSGSSGSYSAPSNSGSNGSYSAPSRSGGSGGGAPSGGSSGGGGGGGGRRR